MIATSKGSESAPLLQETEPKQEKERRNRSRDRDRDRDRRPRNRAPSRSRRVSSVKEEGEGEEYYRPPSFADAEHGMERRVSGHAGSVEGGYSYTSPEGELVGAQCTEIRVVSITYVRCLGSGRAPSPAGSPGGLAKSARLDKS